MSPSRCPAALASTRPIRVFIAEDHHITLWGLTRLIDSSKGMEVVGTARSRDALLSDEAAMEADVLLLDLDLAGESTSESLGNLRERCAGRVLVLTGIDDVEEHREAVLRGAHGVVHKSEPAETILRAIEKVSAGEIWLNRALIGDVFHRLTDTARKEPARALDATGEKIASLTRREREIVATMVSSSGAKQVAVAEKLMMSEHTLRNHLTTIYSKLQVRGRLELYVFASAHRLGLNRQPANDG